MKKEEVRARISVNDIAEMKPKELAFFKKWLRLCADELCNTKDRKVFSKRFRMTLYKSS